MTFSMRGQPSLYLNSAVGPQTRVAQYVSPLSVRDALPRVSVHPPVLILSLQSVPQGHRR